MVVVSQKNKVSKSMANDQNLHTEIISSKNIAAKHKKNKF